MGVRTITPGRSARDEREGDMLTPIPSRATVLLVEDDRGVAATLTDVLEASGYRVWHTENGAGAQAILQGNQWPDLIVLDLTLPDVDGLVLCSQLKAMAAGVPIIICSARDRQQEKVLALKLGADDFVPKPFDLSELEARVEAV